MAARLQCWNCGASLDDLPRPITRHNNCPECFNDLHCCRLCVHFRPEQTISCVEDRADPPVNKENANFCDYFRPAGRAYRDGGVEKQASARSRLDLLFDADETDEGAGDEAQGDAGSEPEDRPATKEDEARAKLDALFGGADENDADNKSD